MELCVRCRLADEIADESADHGTHDANGRGGNESHLIGSWHQRAADPPDDEPHNHRPDDVQHVDSPLCCGKVGCDCPGVSSPCSSRVHGLRHVRKNRLTWCSTMPATSPLSLASMRTMKVMRVAIGSA